MQSTELRALFAQKSQWFKSVELITVKEVLMERKIIVKDDGGKSKELEGESEIVLIETEQDPMRLPPNPPTTPCPLPAFCLWKTLVKE